jgi:hypothetical protein
MKKLVSLGVIAVFIDMSAITLHGSQNRSDNERMQDRFVRAWRLLVWLEEEDADALGLVAGAEALDRSNPRCDQAASPGRKHRCSGSRTYTGRSPRDRKHRLQECRTKGSISRAHRANEQSLTGGTRFKARPRGPRSGALIVGHDARAEYSDSVCF